MIGLTQFTFLTALFWSSIFITALFFITRSYQMLCNISVSSLLFIGVLCILRLYVPIELPFTENFESTIWLPKLFDILSYDIFNMISVGSLIKFLAVIVVVLIFIKKLFIYRHIFSTLTYINNTDNKSFLNILNENKKLLNIKHEIKIMIHKNVGSPSIIGYKNPVILLPDIDFSENELKGILLHELIHYKYKHIYIKLVTEIMCILFWWNPFSYMLNATVSDILELFTDNKLSRLTERAEQKSYLNAITKVVEHYENKNTFSNYSVGFAENNNSLIIRNRFLLIKNNQYSKHKNLLNYIICLAVSFAFVFSYAFVFQPSYEPKVNDYGEGIVMPEKGYLVKHDLGYDVYDSEWNYVDTIAENTLPDDFLSNFEIIN